jgi:anti-anti-sigma factor
VRLREDRAEVAVSDEVDIASEPAMHQVLHEALKAGALHVTISFCGSSFVGGPAVRLALVALEAVAPRGGTVTVRGDEHVRRLFAITGVEPSVTLQPCD